MNEEELRQAREKEGWDQFFLPYPDLPTPDHEAGYEQARRYFERQIDMERQFNQDQQMSWQI